MDKLRLYSDLDGDFTRAYFGAEAPTCPACNVFTRSDGTIRHFWTGEINGAMRPTRARIRAARPTSTRSGPCWT